MRTILAIIFIVFGTHAVADEELQKAKNLGKLKGKSAAQIIQQLSQNLVCG